MPSTLAVQPHGIPNCRKATVRCIDTEIRRLKAAQGWFGCDHRGVFATTYLELTGQLRDTLRACPHFFNDARYLYTEDVLFADIYFNTERDYRRGANVKFEKTGEAKYIELRIQDSAGKLQPEFDVKLWQ